MTDTCIAESLQTTGNRAIHFEHGNVVLSLTFMAELFISPLCTPTCQPKGIVFGLAWS